MKEKKNIIMLCVTAVALVVSICVGAAMLTGANKNKSKSDPQKSEASHTSAATESDHYRILVAGKDRASGLYDVMMLVSLDRVNGSACVLQIPRDTYFEYTDRDYKKINGAPSALGGMRAFCDSLGEALGVKIDSYISFGLDAFADAVDAVGGVEVELDEALEYKDPAQELTISLPKGKQTLDGKTAEHFVRYRSGYLRGDLGRLDAQKIFMAAFFGKVSKLGTGEAIKLATTLLPSVNTDIGAFEMVGLIRDASGIDGDGLSFVTAPGEDIVSAKSGAWYYVLSSKAMSEILELHFAPVGEFDRERLFLNERNKNALPIYEGYSEYKISSAEDIDKNGIYIQQIN